MLAAWGAVIVLFAGLPLWQYVGRGHHWGGDYDIWFNTGRHVMRGEAIYPDPSASQESFNFMYPPPAAAIMAPLTVAGPMPFLLVLNLINAVAWVASVLLTFWLVTGRVRGLPWPVYLAPVVLTLSYTWDTFHLGQSNLVLLALLLGAFACLRMRRDAPAGFLVALAAAFKAFPVLALVYLIYRRHWRAAGWTVVFLAGLLFFLPAPLRGWNQNLTDLSTWSRGMMFHYDAGSIAQRAEAAYRWKNQSIIASVNRLFRHVPADNYRVKVDGEFVETPIYTNVADLSFGAVNSIIVAVGLGLCLAYVAVMPRRRHRSAGSDAIEQAMLLVMMILFSPLSWFYYAVWLLPAFAVVMVYLCETRNPAEQRRRALIWLVAAAVLLNLVLPVRWLQPVRAVGVTFFGDLVLLALLGWLLRKAGGEATGMIGDSSGNEAAS